MCMYNHTQYVYRYKCTIQSFYTQYIHSCTTHMHTYILFSPIHVSSTLYEKASSAFLLSFKSSLLLLPPPHFHPMPNPNPSIVVHFLCLYDAYSRDSNFSIENIRKYQTLLLYIYRITNLTTLTTDYRQIAFRGPSEPGL